MRNSQEARWEDAAGSSASSLCSREEGPSWSSGFLVLVCILFLSRSSQLNVVAVLWEVLIQRLSFPPENLSPGWDQGNRPSWSHGWSPQPLTTAGSNQSRFTSQGGAERNRGSSFSLCPPCVWSKRARLNFL